ncbi:unnamed protein product [Prorocentrum cordatum]|uniref:Uncharacterized protein n=1 Tax=Prorocentrum cordatum TaxID=2364126 RepID=A0ABN9VAI8_9DINO|nr:unnamed protein product [Polarella glacialis]
METKTATPEAQLEMTQDHRLKELDIDSDERDREAAKMISNIEKIETHIPNSNGTQHAENETHASPEGSVHDNGAYFKTLLSGLKSEKCFRSLPPSCTASVSTLRRSHCVLLLPRGR